MDYVASLLTSTAVAAALLGAMAFLLKSLIGHLLQKDLTLHSNQLKAQLLQHQDAMRQQHQISLELFKADLNRSQLEHQVMFTKLHEHRADVCLESYRLLVTLTRSFNAKLNPAQNKLSALNNWTETLALLRKFHDHFEENRIALPPRFCTLAETFVLNVTSLLTEFRFNLDGKIDTDDNDAVTRSLEKTWRSFSRIRTDARMILEDEYRAILSGTSEPPTAGTDES